jgi:hypothetical protein
VVRPRITNSLKGSLGHAYYKEYCDQKGWAYVSLEDIHNSASIDVLTFKKGFHRIRVKVPQELHEEIKLISKPTNDLETSPSFVFDYLACKVGSFEKFEGITESPYFCWVEIKTGTSDLTSNQKGAISFVDLPIAIFHIDDVLVPPEQIDMSYGIGYGEDWEEVIDEDEEDF